MPNTDFLLTEQQPVVAQSAAMRSFVSLLRQIAGSQVPLLFYGESGSGRAFFARYVHQQSAAAALPFIRLDAARLDVRLLDAALGAKPAALHFDEIGKCPPEMQRRILALLDESAAQNPPAQPSHGGGAEASAPSAHPLRFSFSSSRNLEALAENSLFDADLYYRISALPLTVPPLRERREDIVPLAQLLLEGCSRRYNKYFGEISPEAAEALQSAYWGGNFPELAACVDYACAVGVPPRLEKRDLRLNISPVSDIFVESDRTLKSAVDRFKKQYIKQVLNEVRWNQTEAAKILDIQRTYLSRLIKELHIK